MFKVEPPSLVGEIKKARASNYTYDRVICEFIDNARDALINSKQLNKQICINFGLDTNNDLKRALGASTVPLTLVIKDNKIVYRHSGYSPGAEDELYEKVKEYSK